jgi:hypothetical protein
VLEADLLSEALSEVLSEVEGEAIVEGEALNRRAAMRSFIIICQIPPLIPPVAIYRHL